MLATWQRLLLFLLLAGLGLRSYSRHSPPSAQAKLDLCNATDNWLTRLGARELLCQVPLMPVYWLLISGAAYRAIWQFATDPFAWEKTAHRLSHGTKRAATPPQAGYARARRDCESTRSMTCLASTSASSFCITNVCRVDRAKSGRSALVG
jgi:hypothetical protein